MAICEPDTLVKEFCGGRFKGLSFFFSSRSCLVNDLLTMVLWTLEWYCSFFPFFEIESSTLFEMTGGRDFQVSSFRPILFFSSFAWSILSPISTRGLETDIGISVISWHCLRFLLFFLKKILFEACVRTSFPHVCLTVSFPHGPMWGHMRRTVREK